MYCVCMSKQPVNCRMEPYHIFPDLEDCELEQALAAVLSDPPCSSSSDIRDAVRHLFMLANTLQRLHVNV